MKVNKTLDFQRLFEAYEYLPQSLQDFPDALGLKAMIEACGWDEVHFQRLAGGMVAVHIATKKGRS